VAHQPGANLPGNRIRRDDILQRTLLTALVLSIVWLPAGLGAQDAPPVPRTLRVFLDCQFCDFDHFRREVTFVSYVRDRADAQVHVLVTRQGTGAGGREYTFFFIGQEGFAGLQDTLRWASRQDNTDDEVRDGQTRTFALGLVPYAMRTPVADALSVQFEGPEVTESPRQEDDPWNLWVFRLRASGSVEGEQTQNSRSLDGSISADRVTEDLKLEFGARFEYNEDTFKDLEDEEELRSFSRETNADALIVFSIDDHWSWGGESRVGSNTRLNQGLYFSFMPALEYSFYPYRESTRRQITFLYEIGLVYYDYDRQTLFDKLKETLAEQTLEISAGFQQPWGEIDAGIEWSNYLHDFGLHRLDFSSRVEVRLFRGLNFDISGNIARIQNQLFVLRREDITDDEVLLRRAALGTDYEFEIELGLSYTFGSVFNNVVNPRMSRGGGRFFGFN
jgi:hypothetical protein